MITRALSDCLAEMIQAPIHEIWETAVEISHDFVSVNGILDSISWLIRIIDIDDDFPPTR